MAFLFCLSVLSFILIFILACAAYTRIKDGAIILGIFASLLFVVCCFISCALGYGNPTEPITLTPGKTYSIVSEDNEEKFYFLKDDEGKIVALKTKEKLSVGSLVCIEKNKEKILVSIKSTSSEEANSK